MRPLLADDLALALVGTAEKVGATPRKNATPVHAILRRRRPVVGTLVPLVDTPLKPWREQGEEQLELEVFGRGGHASMPPSRGSVRCPAASVPTLVRPQGTWCSW